jgi:hypothetical protein
MAARTRRAPRRHSPCSRHWPAGTRDGVALYRRQGAGRRLGDQPALRRQILRLDHPDASDAPTRRRTCQTCSAFPGHGPAQQLHRLGRARKHAMAAQPAREERAGHAAAGGISAAQHMAHPQHRDRQRPAASAPRRGPGALQVQIKVALPGSQGAADRSVEHLKHRIIGRADVADILRRDEWAMCTAAAPGAVFTVRTSADTLPAWSQGLVRNFSNRAQRNPAGQRATEATRARSGRSQV